MIIRAFLFLLAMLTGVTAANAAGNVHLSPSSIGATALSNSAQVGPSISVGKVDRNLLRHFPAQPRTLVFVKRDYFPKEQFAPAPRTLRSDRARE
jgi:hypothetical protein